MLVRKVGRRTADLIAENSLLVVLVALLGSVLLAIAPQLLVADSWMTLVAGREIAQHGLPSHEALTVMPLGHRWTDQQWLAQLTFYAADTAGGMRVAVLLDIALVTLTLGLGVAVARRRGASARSTLIVAIFTLLVAPWSWQLRAQALALPLYVVVLALAASDVRKPTPRVFLALPLLALWANLHGSVLVGAATISLVGVTGILRRLTAAPIAPSYPRSLALAVASWACVLASPYALHLPGYYRVLLVDSPVSKVVSEWQTPRPNGWYLIFFGVALATAALALWQRRRLGWYEIAILAMTLAGSLRSGRGIVWFALAVLVLVPLALDGALGDREPPARRRLGVAVGTASLAVLSVILVTVAARPSSWYEQEWPGAAPRAVARAATTVSGRKAVFPSDRHGDWLLWKIPALRGRIAYDIRFELVEAGQLASLVRYKTTRRGWQSAAAGYAILVFDKNENQSRIGALRRGHRVRLLYEDGSLAILRRTPG